MKARVKDILNRSDQILFANFKKYLPVAIIIVAFNALMAELDVPGLLLIIAGIFTSLIEKGASIETYYAVKEGREVDPLGFYKRYSENKELLYLAIELNIKLVLWYLLLIIPGIIKSLEYQRAYILKIENPELDSSICISRAKEDMRGRKMKLFLAGLRIYLPVIIFFLGLLIFFTPLILANAEQAFLAPTSGLTRAFIDKAVGENLLYVVLLGIGSIFASFYLTMRYIPVETAFNNILDEELGIDHSRESGNVEDIYPNIEKYKKD